MLSYLFELFLLLCVDVLWWRTADRRLRLLRGQLVMRFALGVFMAGQIAYLLWVATGPLDLDLPEFWPQPWAAAAYCWHILLLPVGCIAFVTRWHLDRRPRAKATTPIVAAVPQTDVAAAPRRVTRRQLLGAAAAAAPPILALAATGKATAQVGEFRVRQVELPVPNLPADLDGLKIAHVTDLHLGRFMPLELIGPIADAVNGLSCDLVAFTGDLLDASCKAVTPGIDFIRRLDPRHGLVMIEGNHDVMAGADRFEQGVKDAGLPLLLDEAKTLRVPGRDTPVQFLGITWGEMKLGRELHHYGKEAKLRFRKSSPDAWADSISRVAALRDARAFPILLSHHPHGFDPAVKHGLPLVLSGHTHGGQLMLTKNIGVGPARFRYWSGAYRKPGSRLFISNGIGSWFPLRVNAPAEIVCLTLRSAEPDAAIG